MATPKESQKRYGRGTPGDVRHLAGGQFAVQSFRSPNEWYVVDLTAGTCSCSHFEKWVGPALDAGKEVDRCKHYELAKAEQLHMVRKKAQTLTAAQLRATLRKFSYAPDVEGTIREVLQEKLLELVQSARDQVRNRYYCRV